MLGKRPSFLQFLLKEVPGLEKLDLLIGQSKPGFKNERTGIGRQRRYSQARNANDERGDQRGEKHVKHMEAKPE